MSNLATVERVVSVTNHPNADRLDIVRILGYDAIVPRDSLKEEDLIVFVQPDSILPSDQDWSQEYLRYTKGGRLRAVRLRGEWSMGLVLPLTTLPGFEASIARGNIPKEGADVTKRLGVYKFEPKLPNNTQAKGGLPFNIPKTDEERWQNIRSRDMEQLIGQEADVTLKIDGQSGTYYCVLAGHWPGVEETRVGICSRSLELKVGIDAEGNPLNSNWHEAERRYDILNRLRNYCEAWGVSLALRGEVYGRGIQSFNHNPHSKEDINFAGFSVYNITEKRYEVLGDPHYFLELGAALGIPSVPTLEERVPLTAELIAKYDHELKQVAGNPFEGVVIKHKNGSFKVINKWYDAEKE